MAGQPYVILSAVALAFIAFVAGGLWHRDLENSRSSATLVRESAELYQVRSLISEATRALSSHIEIHPWETPAGIAVCHETVDARRMQRICNAAPGLCELTIMSGEIHAGARAPLISCGQLRKVLLIDVELSVVNMRHLSACRGLEFLGMECCRVTEGGLAELAKLQNLCVIEFDEMEFTAEQLAALSSIRSLEEMHLHDSLDEGLNGVELFEGLTALYVGGSEFDDSAAARIAQVSSLSHVYLDQSRISDEGVGVLCEMPQLERLSIGSSVLTNECLFSLRHARKLRYVNLEGSRVTESEARSLLETHPEIVVTGSGWSINGR